MKTWVMDVTVKVNAETVEDAWEKVNNHLGDVRLVRVTNISEPKEVT